MKDGQVKETKSLSKQKYQIRFFFDWAEYYLWSDSSDAYTRAHFDCYPISPQQLNIPQPLIELLDSLRDEYLSSFDDYPSAPRLWTFDRSLDFYIRMQSATEMLKECLKDTCDIIDESPKIESYGFIKEAYAAELQGDKTIIETWYKEEYGWDDVLRGLQLILLVSENMMLCEYAKNIIWNGMTQGKTLGIDKDNVVALLYNRFSNVDNPREDGTLWNVVTTAYNLGDDSDYNPLKDEKILAILSKFDTICNKGKFKELNHFLERRRDSVHFKWRITDDIRSIALTPHKMLGKLEIHGEFQMAVNGVNLNNNCNCSKENRDRSPKCRDILFILNELNDIRKIEDGETANVLCLKSDQARHTMTRKGNNFYLRQYNRCTNEEEWCIEIAWVSFSWEIFENGRQFINYIKKENPDLLQDIYVKALEDKTSYSSTRIKCRNIKKKGHVAVNKSSKFNKDIKKVSKWLWGPDHMRRFPEELLLILSIARVFVRYTQRGKLNKKS